MRSNQAFEDTFCLLAGRVMPRKPGPGEGCVEAEAALKEKRAPELPARHRTNAGRTAASLRSWFRLLTR